MLKIDHLSASYKTIDGNVHVVKDVDFEINDNEIFGIAGESGCGKSTLLKTLYDIIEFPLEIDSGKVILSGEKNGHPFSYESGQIRKSWWNNISYVPQAAQSVLNPIVRLKSQFLDSIPKEDRKNETEKQTLDRVGKYLEELGLSRDVLEAFPFQLSGGMLMGKKLTAIDDVSLDIDAGKPVILSIVGESGCGKSTLCKMILRLYKPDMGDIRLLGNSYADKKAYNPKQFKLDVQPIFQNPYESFSARKTVDTYLFNTALRLGICKNHAEAEKVVDETLRSVGMSLAVVKDKYPTQFSGGELQRVSIARALITRPKLIIADEPVAAIDASMKMNIVNLFKDLKDQYNVSFIYITHDLSTAYYVSDYIATLYRGGLIEYGPAKEIMDNPAHPYTELLMNAVPRVGDKWDQEMVMPDMEDKEYAITYCKFAPRCPYATDECRKRRPDMIDLGGQRKVLCFHSLVKPQ